MSQASNSMHSRASYSGGGPRVVSVDRSRFTGAERRARKQSASAGRALVPGEALARVRRPPPRQLSNDDMSVLSNVSGGRLTYDYGMQPYSDDEVSVATAKTLDSLHEQTRQLTGLVQHLSQRLELAEQRSDFDDLSTAARSTDFADLPEMLELDLTGKEDKSLSMGTFNRLETVSKAPSLGPRSYIDSTVILEGSFSEPEVPIYSDPLPQAKGGPTTCIHQVWYSFAALVTFFIPSCLVCREGASAKQAWREKVAICFIVACTSVFFVGLFGAAPLLYCRDRGVYTYDQMWKQEGQGWSVIYGTIYDMKPFIERHPGGSQEIVDFLGKDASRLFPRLPPSQLPPVCLNSKINVTKFNEVACSEFTGLEELTLHCHTSLVGMQPIHEFFNEHEKGKLVYTGDELGESNMKWIRIFDRVYDVTEYVESLKDETSYKYNVESENAYLDPVLTTMIVNKLKEDATGVYETLFDDMYDYIDCMDELFLVGHVDDHFDVACFILQNVMYGLMIFVAVNLALQAFFSLMYLARKQRDFKQDDSVAPVMIMVPCYNEGKQVLKKTIDSVLDSKYADENKVLTVVTDGLIKGKGESHTTPEYLSQLLGFTLDPSDHAHEYQSLGSKDTNNASVYFGTHSDTREGKARSLKYIVIVKRGTAEEASSARAGNRGKRDSQIILQGMFNRYQNNREPLPLDLAIGQALEHLGFSVKSIEYLMTIDADTRVAHDAMQHMVCYMEDNLQVVACCGETEVENKATSWVTMIQVFEYFASHHLKKAFESVFGCVTCLPGCFTMYRLQRDDGGSLWADDDVIQSYSRNDITSLHDRNLYDLGEDRMLTTILLQNFPGMRLSFVPEAVCWTVVPHTYSVLLSQRRRWINSTFHNQMELLKVQTMCGVFCVSMKMVVIFDLLSTMILPASLIQAGIFIAITITNPQDADTLVVALFLAIIVVQMLTFILRSRFDHFFWYLIYTFLGIPIFYFILPLYSFWNMDDFSWGATRQVAKAAANQEEVVKTDALNEKKAGSSIAKDSVSIVKEAPRQILVKIDASETAGSGITKDSVLMIEEAPSQEVVKTDVSIEQETAVSGITNDSVLMTKEAPDTIETAPARAPNDQTVGLPGADIESAVSRGERSTPEGLKPKGYAYNVHDVTDRAEC